MLLVKLTDKNFGIAVITKDWYQNKYHQDLSNIKTYIKIDNYNLVYSLQKTLYSVCHEIKLPEVYLKYIKAKTKAKFPHFYVISKVHKNPLAFLPILPSHSWVTLRLLEVLDNLLCPLLKKFRWVIDCTKKFICRLEAVPVYYWENI